MSAPQWPNKLRRNLTNCGDGYAKLDVFRFDGSGGVSYTSKFARSAWWNKSVAIDDIAPSLSFGTPDPPRSSDRIGLPNVLASNDNLAVNIISVQGRLLMISDQPGSISFDPNTLEFGKAASPMPPHNAFVDHPPLPVGMMGAFGSAHPLYTGSSLDSSGDLYGLLNVQRLTTVDKRPEQIRLFKINVSSTATSTTTGEERARKRAPLLADGTRVDGGLGEHEPIQPWLTRHTVACPRGSLHHTCTRSSSSGAPPPRRPSAGPAKQQQQGRRPRTPFWSNIP